MAAACRLATLVLLGFCGVPAGIAAAPDYPVRPIRFIVGAAPDVLPRLVGQRLTDTWGQQVVVDQRSGAGGSIAAETAAKAAPDGYTLLLTTGAYSVNAVYYSKLPYDLVRDFAPVGLLATIQFLLVVHPSVPVKSIEELVQLARARPGQLNCASGGNGTTSHFGCEMLKSRAQIDVVHVPYRGVVPAITEVLGGQVQMMFTPMQAGLPHVRAGKLKALGVGGAKRASAAPDLPTVAEAGVPGFAFDSWNGVHVPVRTPGQIIAKLNTELAKAISLPEVQKRMLDLGLEPAGGTPGEFAAFVKADIARWASVVKDAGVRTE